MFGDTHKLVTHEAMRILNVYSNHDLLEQSSPVENAAVEIDNLKDVEFISVRGNIDNRPHKISLLEMDDLRYNKMLMFSLTTFNHFIDIGKEEGHFDDFDGYSYEKGSASKDQQQSCTEFVLEKCSNGLADILADISLTAGMKTDEILHKVVFNNHYVHILGHPEYEDCSPATENYSFFQDMMKYPDKESELESRFPRKEGVSRSVFMPLDNLGRYNWKKFKETGKKEYLGYVLHAVQDATVPQHAAGYSGNWHTWYENQLEKHMADFLKEAEDDAVQLFEQWYDNEGEQPRSLRYEERNIVKPSRKWEIEDLITWCAFQAYEVYQSDIAKYKDRDFEQISENMKNLARLALAASLFVTARAVNYETPVSLKMAEIPELDWRPHVLEFKGVPPGEQAEKLIEITNNSQKPVTVSKIIEPENRVFVLEDISDPLPFQLAPGKSIELRIRFDRPEIIKLWYQDLQAYMNKTFKNLMFKEFKLLREVLSSLWKTYTSTLKIITMAENQEVKLWTILITGGNMPDLKENKKTIERISEIKNSISGPEDVVNLRNLDIAEEIEGITYVDKDKPDRAKLSLDFLDSLIVSPGDLEKYEQKYKFINFVEKIKEDFLKEY